MLGCICCMLLLFCIHKASKCSTIVAFSSQKKRKCLDLIGLDFMNVII